MPPAPSSQEEMALIKLDDHPHKVIEIRATGDVILDVTFENTPSCTKSIPSEVLQKLRISKSKIPSPQVLFRVRLDTLKKHSKYFAHLLGSDVFGEGRLIKDTFSKLAELNMKPSEVEVDLLPRIKIVDDDDATRTMGRENVFRDMLRIIHGAEHLTKPITITYLAVLVVMADRFDCLGPISRYVTGTFVKFKYPTTLDKSAEEILRQKILIFYHTKQAPQLVAATKELILRGSSRWSASEDSLGLSTAWWDLPDSLEAELFHRRVCVLRTIASLQMHFVDLYTSRTRQCALGYDSSGACDSFQLGEMIKFLSKKELLFLIPFQTASPEDPDYIWPEAYKGDIEQLIGLLRQCPPYQIDHNHHHCGFRVRILPALDYIKDCVDTGIGINPLRWKTDRAAQTWVPIKDPQGYRKKPFIIGDKSVNDPKINFDFTKARSTMQFGANSLDTDKSAKSLFTAETRTWTGKEANSELMKSSLKW